PSPASGHRPAATQTMRNNTLSMPATAVAAVLAVLCGWIVAHDAGPSVLAIGAGLGLVAILLVERPGVAIGLLVLSVQDGLPFVDTGRHAIYGLSVDNYLTLALIIFLATRISSDSLKSLREAPALVIAGS